MNYYSIIKGDFLQRTRSYAFLVTMAITLWAAYVLVPPVEASYTTLNVVGFKGVYNSAWVGHVSAMMVSILIFLFGFFLVNNSIKKDEETEVGLILASTPVSNFQYLFSKAVGNFLVLLSIVSVVFLSNIIICLWRAGVSSFHLSDFILPYGLIVLPVLCVISTMAVIAEVFLGKRTAVQYLLWFFIFVFSVTYIVNALPSNGIVMLDIFGVKSVMISIQKSISEQFHTEIKGVAIGYSGSGVYKVFQWEGVVWSPFFIIGRLCWIAFGFAGVVIASRFFHRFDFTKSKDTKAISAVEEKEVVQQTIKTSVLPPVRYDYGILPFIKTELRLMVRRGPRWLWLISIGLWISLWLAPSGIAHQFLLPILWFLQVGRISDLVTKEKSNRVHYFAFASYKPLQRMLPAQLLAGVLLMSALAMPLFIRSLVVGDIFRVMSIPSGALFIILFSACLGIISNGKKLFEIVFFAITYGLTQNAVPFDYFGAFVHDRPIIYLLGLTLFSMMLTIVTFITRSYEIRRA